MGGMWSGSISWRHHVPSTYFHLLPTPAFIRDIMSVWEVDQCFNHSRRWSSRGHYLPVIAIWPPCRIPNERSQPGLSCWRDLWTRPWIMMVHWRTGEVLVILKCILQTCSRLSSWALLVKLLSKRLFRWMPHNAFDGPGNGLVQLIWKWQSLFGKDR